MGAGSPLPDPILVPQGNDLNILRMELAERMKYFLRGLEILSTFPCDTEDREAERHEKPGLDEGVFDRKYPGQGFVDGVGERFEVRAQTVLSGG
jgi:hypothetical protein